MSAVKAASHLLRSDAAASDAGAFLSKSARRTDPSADTPAADAQAQPPAFNAALKSARGDRLKSADRQPAKNPDSKKSSDDSPDASPSAVQAQSAETPADDSAASADQSSDPSGQTKKTPAKNAKLQELDPNQVALNCPVPPTKVVPAELAPPAAQLPAAPGNNPPPDHSSATDDQNSPATQAALQQAVLQQVGAQPVPAPQTIASPAAAQPAVAQPAVAQPAAVQQAVAEQAVAQIAQPAISAEALRPAFIKQGGKLPGPPPATTPHSGAPSEAPLNPWPMITEKGAQPRTKPQPPNQAALPQPESGPAPSPTDSAPTTKNQTPAQSLPDTASAPAALSDSATVSVHALSPLLTDRRTGNDAAANANSPKPADALPPPPASPAAGSSDPETAIEAPATGNDPKPIAAEAKPALTTLTLPISHENAPQGANAASAAQETPRTETSDPLDQIILGLQGKFDPRSGKAEIRLDPPNLGVVKVSLSLENGALTAEFQSDSSMVRDLLKGNIEKLKTVLESQGVAIDRLAVNAPPSADASAARGQSQQGSFGSAAHDGRSAGQNSQDPRGGGGGGQRRPEPDGFARVFRQTQAAPIDLVA